MNNRQTLIAGIFFFILLVILYLVLANLELPEEYQPQDTSGVISYGYSQ